LKKLAAILLIALFIFNLFGYRIFFYFAQQQADIKLENALDKNQYDEKDLVTLKIPILLPYQPERKDFERCYGEITLDGKVYKYVKRKICDGNLVLLCLPDHNRTHLENAKNDFFKSSNDLQNISSKKPGHSKPGSGKNLLHEYYQNMAGYRMAFYKVLHNFSLPNSIAPLSPGLHSSPEQPPEST
jgi:hypothetical protein